MNCQVFIEQTPPKKPCPCIPFTEITEGRKKGRFFTFFLHLCVLRVLRELRELNFLEEVGHFEGGQHGVPAFVAGLGAGAFDCLLDIVCG